MGSTGRPLPWHGAAAETCWLIHAARHVLGGTAHDLLWACNVAVPMLALGCFAGRAMPCAVALSWLAFGTPIWLLDLAMGAGLIITSPLVHVVAPLLAISALRRLGCPDCAWVFATAGTLPLLVASRLLGTTAANPNLAFRVHPPQAPTRAGRCGQGKPAGPGGSAAASNLETHCEDDKDRWYVHVRW
jgi:hypothetical protein